MNRFVVIILIIMIVVILSISLNHKTDLALRVWSDYCRSEGGIVQQVSSSQLECFKENKIILHYE